MFAAVLAGLFAAGCGDDGGVLGDQASTTTDAVTTTIGGAPVTTRTAPSTTRVPGKTGQPPSTTAVTRVPFDPPQPTTTPNVAQPRDSLLDGEHVAFLVDVDASGRTVDIDVVQWILRPDFEAAIADGRLSADDPCTELDYCIANAQDRVRTMPVSAGARVSTVDYDACCGSVRTDALDDVFLRMREGRDLFVVTVSGGQVTALDELYLA